MMRGVTCENIESLHTNVAKVVRGLTRANLQIVSTAHRNTWKIAPRNEDISFEFESLNKSSSGVLIDYIERNRGGRTCVIRLIEQELDEPTLWASWYEQWKVTPERENRYNLIALSWTFYWGVYNRPRPNILRADWDALSSRSPEAAQPHWHIDPSLLVDTYKRIRLPSSAIATTDELVELSDSNGVLQEISPVPTGLQELPLGQMHLGMGGWTHSPHHPSCWRQHLPTVWNEITDWARKTLQYARAQFIEHVHPDEPFDI